MLSERYFIAWHLAFGVFLVFYGVLRLWQYIWRQFSPVFLLKTLFSPWKLQIIKRHKPGLDLQELVQVVTFNSLSRTIGAVIRLTTLVIGLLIFVLTIPVGIIAGIVLILFPLPLLPIYYKYKSHCKLKLILKNPKKM